MCPGLVDYDAIMSDIPVQPSNVKVELWPWRCTSAVKCKLSQKPRKQQSSEQERSYSSSLGSSAEVANAKSISASGYRKRLSDVVTMECSAAILKAAEIKRQELGQKTAGKGLTAADREEKEQNELLAQQEASAKAVQYIGENAASLTEKSESALILEGGGTPTRSATHPATSTEATEAVDQELQG
ncbi:hypothetical protein ACROYT_G014974 [Oculina patagonica]